MTLRVSHRFIVEASSESGSPIGDYPLTSIDFEPAARSAHLCAMRFHDAEMRSALPTARLRVVTCPVHGDPYISGFDVEFPELGISERFTLDYLHDTVVRDAASLVLRGLMSPGQRFAYRVYAIPKAEAPRKGNDFELEAVDDRLKVWRARLPGPFAGGTRDRDADLPVAFRANVIDEAVAASRTAPEVETGGLLLGRLCRDPDLDDLFVDVSAMLPAAAAEATETSLRFTPEVFAELERLRALRREGECLLGWFHSHPFFCRSCPEDRRASCPFGQSFFSQADRDVHRALFPQPYSQALLISDLGQDQPSVDLFSWRRGRIEHRDFIVTDPTWAAVSDRTLIE